MMSTSLSPSAGFRYGHRFENGHWLTDHDFPYAAKDRFQQDRRASMDGQCLFLQEIASVRQQSPDL